MIHNRRKKAEFFQQQKVQHASAIESARYKIQHGTATEEDIKFIQLEDAHAAEIEAKARAKAEKKENSVFNRGKRWLFSGLKKEEEGDDVGTSENRLGYEALSEEDEALGERDSDIVRAIEDKIQEKKLGIADKAKQAFDKEKERERTGGYLDRIGTASNKDGEQPKLGDQPESRGWFSWMTGR